MKAERAAFEKLKAIIPPEKLIFIDESGCNIALTRSHAWAPCGLRASDVRPFSRWKNLSLIGAIRLTGPVALRTVAGSVNTDRFLSFVRNDLCPKLGVDDVVVLDNLKPHHALAVQREIEARGAHVLFLPPYSPDFNPIELVWGWLKTRVRRGLRPNLAALRSAIHRAWNATHRLSFVNLWDACGWRGQVM